jgi:hypothetical protein
LQLFAAALFVGIKQWALKYSKKAEDQGNFIRKLPFLRPGTLFCFYFGCTPIFSSWAHFQV